VKTIDLPRQFPTVPGLKPAILFRLQNSRVRWLLFLGLCAGLSGCTTPTTSIVSQPPGALIAVDGVNVGAAPVQYKFDFRHTPTTVVVASKEGYINEQIVLTADSSAIHGSELPVVLVEDPAYKATTTCEADNNWLRVQVEPSLAPDVVWQKLVDSVTGRYSSLEMIDSASGYMRSVYILRKFPEKSEELWVRTRFICSISSKTPLVYKMKIESEQATPASAAQENWSPYERVFKEDAQLVEEIQGRLGVK
jgi:hypothetical protein